ncbi:MAG: hypothetical protein ACRD1O_12550 [Terriglobia bacterium]
MVKASSNENDLVLDCFAGSGGSLPCGHLSGAETEAENPVRETLDHFAAILRYSALLLLRAGRRHPANSRKVQPQTAS